MSKPKFTPGPWVIDVDCRNRTRAFAGRSEIVRALSSHGARRLPEHERAANRSLISAAPDMYEALADMLAGWQYIRMYHGDLYGVGWDRAESAAVAALAKAEGRGK